MFGVYCRTIGNAKDEDVSLEKPHGTILRIPKASVKFL